MGGEMKKLIVILFVLFLLLSMAQEKTARARLIENYGEFGT